MGATRTLGTQAVIAEQSIFFMAQGIWSAMHRKSNERK
jgi:hypothetical protein